MRTSGPRQSTFAFALFVYATIAASTLARDQGDPAVRDAFLGYKSAILAADGTTAVTHVSQSTINYFDEMQKLALHGTAADVRAQSLINQMQILLFRHRLEPQQVKGMSPRQLFVYGVDKGWIGKNSVVALEAGATEVSGDVATIEIVQSGKPTGLKFRFLRENGGWRLDLVPVLQLGNAALKLAAKQQGITEEFLILSLLESVSGKKVPPSIWDPLVPRPY
jgi:hypothetical protein